MIRFLSTSLIVIVTAVFVPASQTAEEAWYSIALRNKENDKNKAFLYIENNPALPNVLIYGDSISIAYTPIVRGLLEGGGQCLPIAREWGFFSFAYGEDGYASRDDARRENQGSLDA